MAGTSIGNWKRRESFDVLLASFIFQRWEKGQEKEEISVTVRETCKKDETNKKVAHSHKMSFCDVCVTWKVAVIEHTHGNFSFYSLTFFARCCSLTISTGLLPIFRSHRKLSPPPV